MKLTLIQAHDRPIDDDILSGGRQGWPAILCSLKSVLETGSALVIKMEPPQRMLAGAEEDGDRDAVDVRSSFRGARQREPGISPDNLWIPGLRATPASSDVQLHIGE